MGIEKMMAICLPLLLILVLEAFPTFIIFIVKVTNVVPHLYTVPQSLLAETSVDPVVFWLFGRCIG